MAKLRLVLQRQAKSACSGECSRLTVAATGRLHPVACRLSVRICGVASTASDRSSTAYRLDASSWIEVDSKSPETAPKSGRCQIRRQGSPGSSTVSLRKSASSSKPTTCSLLRRRSNRSTRPSLTSQEDGQYENAPRPDNREAQLEINTSIEGCAIPRVQYELFLSIEDPV